MQRLLNNVNTELEEGKEKKKKRQLGTPAEVSIIVFRTALGVPCTSLIRFESHFWPGKGVCLGSERAVLLVLGKYCQ